MAEAETIMAEKPPRWFYTRKGGQRGPFSTGEMAELARSGDLLKSDLVWRLGFGEWLEAGSVPELSGEFGSGAVGRAANASPSIERFRDPSGLTQLLIGLLIADMAIELAAAAARGFELGVLLAIQRGTFADETSKVAAAKASDLAQGLVALPRLTILVATIVVFVKWIVRANFNVRQLGATGLRFAPYWAAGWYFVPFANLWLPYQAMSEIWRASKSPAAWQQCGVGWLPPIWWTLFLLNDFVANFAAMAGHDAKDPEAMAMASAMSVVSDLVSVAAALAALLLVGSVKRMQVRNWHGRNGPARSFQG